MNKKQREELQDRARLFNGLFAKWRNARTDENYAQLEASIDSFCDCWNEVKLGKT